MHRTWLKSARIIGLSGAAVDYAQSLDYPAFQLRDDMTKLASDQRSPDRRARDEQIAGEPKLTIPQSSNDAQPAPVEEHLARQTRRPFAVPGIVENGLVRPLDASVKLPEHSRVIIVASDGQ